MEGALEAYHATGAHLVQPYFRALIADAYRRLDRLDRARVLLDDALVAAERTGELVYLPELHRLRGEVDGRAAILDGTSMRALGPVEARLRRALELAQAQQSNGLALRAATSLARLLRSLDRRDEASTLLGRARARIEEGHDTPDWLEATAVFESLGKGNGSGTRTEA
jgi:lipopolysaccharide biosynthesis regulator YciM